MRLTISALLALALALVSCKSTYYKVWEKLGREKRDLLHSHVSAVKDQQQESAEHFKDALTRLQEAYGKPSTKLQSVYQKLKDDDERAQAEAETLRKRTERMNTTAEDLFREWETEIESFTNPEFKTKSRLNLNRAQVRFKTLSHSLSKSTAKMKPILGRLHETVLFLKHNLNAQALGAMKQGSREIEESLESLVTQMNISIREADEFLSVLKEDEG